MKKYCTGCHSALLVKHTVVHAWCLKCREYVVIADTKKQAKIIYQTREEESKKYFIMNRKTTLYINNIYLLYD